VRLSCPLKRIAHVRFGSYAEFPCIASLCVVGLSSDERSDGFDEGITEAQTIQIGTVRPNPVWGQLNDYINAAKRRLEWRPLDQFPVLIDFGPLSFTETQASWDLDSAGPQLREKTIRGALALDSGESHLWSKFFRHSTSIFSNIYLFSYQGSSISQYLLVWLSSRLSAFRLLLEQIVYAL
jgi:hypothetical protein